MNRIYHILPLLLVACVPVIIGSLIQLFFDHVFIHSNTANDATYQAIWLSIKCSTFLLTAVSLIHAARLIDLRNMMTKVISNIRSATEGTMKARSPLDQPELSAAIVNVFRDEQRYSIKDLTGMAIHGSRTIWANLFKSHLDLSAYFMHHRALVPRLVADIAAKNNAQSIAQRQAKMMAASAAQSAVESKNIALKAVPEATLQRREQRYSSLRPGYLYKP